MKKVVLFVTLLLISFNVGALELNSKNAVLYNLNENKIIYEENKDEITELLVRLGEVLGREIKKENIEVLKTVSVEEIESVDDEEDEEDED